MISQKFNKSIKSILRRIGLAACVYYIWNERNKRVFTNEKQDVEVLINTIVNHIRLKLSSLNVKESLQVANVCKKWNVTMNLKKGDDSVIQSIYNGAI